MAEKFGIDSRRVYLAEIDLDAVKAAENPVHGIQELPKFPAVSRDIAVVVDEKTGSGTMLEAIREAGGRDARGREPVRHLPGHQAGRKAKKSVAYSITASGRRIAP